MGQSTLGSGGTQVTIRPQFEIRDHNLIHG
jgi:hypothetical protein